MEKITLIKPIERGEEVIEQIEIREPSAGELRGVRLTDLLNGDIDSLITVLPRITIPALQKHEVNALCPQDIAILSGEVMGLFMPAG